MAQINVSLPPALKTWVDRQVADGRYSNPSDYIRSLLRHDEERVAELAALQAAIDKGRSSGAGRPYKDVFADLNESDAVAA